MLRKGVKVKILDSLEESRELKFPLIRWFVTFIRLINIISNVYHLLALSSDNRTDMSAPTSQMQMQT